MTTSTTEPQFFFDTAEIDYIQKSWTDLKNSGHFTGKEVLGITTNPNALSKVSCKTMEAYDKLVRELCETVSSIRQDDKGVVCVQIPNSNRMTEQEIMTFATHSAALTDGKTKVALKIPPALYVLKMVPELQKIMDVNVTGLAECSTALKCITHGVDWISVIPGRMEEASIDAKRQIRFINQANKGKTQVIAGSMRTLEGLAWVIQENTVPTIGTRVFDLIFLAGPEGITRFRKMWDEGSKATAQEATELLSPPINYTMTQLSVSFFQQMDQLGFALYQDFLAQLQPETAVE